MFNFLKNKIKKFFFILFLIFISFFLIFIFINKFLKIFNPYELSQTVKIVILILLLYNLAKNQLIFFGFLQKKDKNEESRFIIFLRNNKWFSLFRKNNKWFLLIAKKIVFWNSWFNENHPLKLLHTHLNKNSNYLKVQNLSYKIFVYIHFLEDKKEKSKKDKFLIFVFNKFLVLYPHIVFLMYFEVFFFNVYPYRSLLLYFIYDKFINLLFFYHSEVMDRRFAKNARDAHGYKLFFHGFVYTLIKNFNINIIGWKETDEQDLTQKENISCFFDNPIIMETWLEFLEQKNKENPKNIEDLYLYLFELVYVLNFYVKRPQYERLVKSFINTLEQIYK